jgi:hypothetical protein
MEASMRPHSDECGKRMNDEVRRIAAKASMRPHSDECGKGPLY